MSATHPPGIPHQALAAWIIRLPATALQVLDFQDGGGPEVGVPLNVSDGSGERMAVLTLSPDEARKFAEALKATAAEADGVAGAPSVFTGSDGGAFE